MQTQTTHSETRTTAINQPARSTTETPALTFETAATQADYRALREGRVPAPEAETPSAAADAAIADATPAAAEEAETAENHSEESQEEETGKKSGGKLNARFSELTAKIRNLETELAAAKQRGGAGQPEMAEATPAAAPAAVDPASDPEPAPEKFGTYVEWQKAWTRWDRRQEQRAADAARAEAERKSAALVRAQTWQEKVKTAAAELTDFESVALNKDLPVTPVMADAITESDLGPAVLYHLGKHPAEAARIAKLSALSQVRELGKIEAALAAAEAPSSNEPAPPQTKATHVSKAPAPLKPIAGSAASSANPLKHLDSMTQAEYRAYRESGKIR